MPKTLQQAAQDALLVQDACNLSGVAHSFVQIIADVIWPEARRRGKGTDWVNQHPIVTLFLDKMASLNRTQCLCGDNLENFRKAYAEVERLSSGNADLPTSMPQRVVVQP